MRVPPAENHGLAGNGLPSGNRRLPLQTRWGQEAFPKLLFRLLDGFLILENSRLAREEPEKFLIAQQVQPF
ncbi:hypothetical protein [Gluconacetobacter asukensis]|uniref:Uncharacterized protein n=1 Tax=Gluconacetobacter asukensis TaxID=1017181 RepID=A0A7W4J1U2_9PROT|nr:hypothetical protein [Gluconacetobacter asukensis]MBB2172937.1 hypothetical protein [Gluconacetobacter asukensis]